MNQATRFLALLAAASLSLLAGCDGGSLSANNPLDGTSWELAASRNTMSVPRTPVTVVFRHGVVKGSMGCNTYRAAYHLAGVRIRFDHLLITQNACPVPADIMKQERVIKAFLTDAEKISLSETQLQIYRPDGQVLTFEPRP